MLLRRSKRGRRHRPRAMIQRLRRRDMTCSATKTTKTLFSNLVFDFEAVSFCCTYDILEEQLVTLRRHIHCSPWA